MAPGLGEPLERRDVVAGDVPDEEVHGRGPPRCPHRPDGGHPPARFEAADDRLQGRPGAQNVVGEAEQGGVEGVVGPELLLGQAEPQVDVAPPGPGHPLPGPAQSVWRS